MSSITSLCLQEILMAVGIHKADTVYNKIISVVHGHHSCK